MSKLRIVGVDPGFANVGLCVVDILDVGGSVIVATKLVVTKPSSTKTGKLEDEQRRLEEIEDAVISLLNDYEPDVLAMEEPGKCLMRRPNRITKKPEWVTNPSLLRTSCLMWGAVHGICRARGIYCVKVGSQEIKKTLCGKKNASKEDVIKAVKSKYPSYTDWPTTKKVEHVADAVGAAVASFSKPAVMVMTRKLRTP